MEAYNSIQKKPYRILLADDSESIHDLVRFIFKPEKDFLVEFSINGELAIQKAFELIPDLILMDLEMPVLSGSDAVRVLKQDERTANIPVIMLTGSGNIQEAFNVGAVDYVKKPFERAELIARVRNAISMRISMEDLKQKTQEIENQKNELESQKEQIEKQYANLDRQREEFTDSILYAKRIMRALHPPDSVMLAIHADAFVFNKPKVIIGGDFFWIREFGEKTLVAVGDGTGHGIPGAFMSVLGVTLLSDIFNRCIVANHLPQAHEIVDQLRTRTIEALHRAESMDGSDDGMAISLCILDRSKMELEFCGAQQSICIISDGALTQIKGDPYSVGYFHGLNDPFSIHVIKLKKGDLVYIYSDGYSDQLGGVEYRKFMTKRFRNLLLSIHKRSLTDQKFALDKTILEWQGGNEQVDDMLVVGFRI
jgi:CheY-like chemotaxis protein